MKKKLINWLCLSGIVAVIFYLLHDIVGAANYPGYDWIHDPVSNLTAIGAHSEYIANAFVTGYKIFACLCCVLACIIIKNQKQKSLRLGVYLFTVMNFISAIGYAFVPLHYNSNDNATIQLYVHETVITPIVVLLSIISLIMIAVGAFKQKQKKFAALALAALACMFIGSVFAWNVAEVGIFERFSLYSAVIFTGILGLYCFKIKA